MLLAFVLSACNSGGGPFPNDTTTITVSGIPSDGLRHGADARLFLFTTHAAALNPGVYAASGNVIGGGPSPAFVMQQGGVPVFVSGDYFVRLELHPSADFPGPLEILVSGKVIRIRRTTIIQFIGDLGWEP